MRIAGIVLSPEYVFATRPGDPIPDDARYGIMWMARKGLAAAFDMEGAFNDLTATLAPGADQAAVLDAIDRLLEPYGGLVAHGRHDQPSHRFLTDEIAQQGVMATTMPTVFLAVAVFLLHGMLGRLVGTQREQVAALKALGYANRSIAWHYVEFALAIVGLGGAFGLASGLWFGRLMVENYTRFFRFPQLAFEISPWVVVLALLVSLVGGLAGALSAVRSVMVLAPAEAMRPPAPRRYHHGTLERLIWVRRIPPRGQMVLRRLTDRPIRTLFTITGIALAAPIIVMSLFWQDALDEMINVQFSAVDRSDVTASFTNAVPGRAAREIARLPGVLLVEAYRTVAVELRAGTHTYRTAITGLPAKPVLRQLVDSEMKVHHPGPTACCCRSASPVVLGLQLGDRVSVAVLEGRRPRVDMTVTGLVDEMLGIGAYAEIDTVHRLMGEADAISSVSIAAGGDTSVLRRQLSDRPKVATISERSVSLRQFRETTLTFVLVMAGTLSLFSVMIAIGVVYNHARIALAGAGVGTGEPARPRLHPPRGRRRAADRIIGAIADRLADRSVSGQVVCPRHHRDARHRAVRDPRDHPPALLCARSHRAIAERCGQCAAGAPPHRRPGSGRRAEDAGVAPCRASGTCCFLAAIAVVGALALALRPRPVDVEVARVVRGHFEASIVEDGKTRVRERYTIAAPVAGTLLRIGLKAGDTVTAGRRWRRSCRTWRRCSMHVRVRKRSSGLARPRLPKRAPPRWWYRQRLRRPRRASMPSARARW